MQDDNIREAEISDNSEEAVANQPAPAPLEPLSDQPEVMEIVSLQALRQLPQQGEMPFAVVQGKPITELPKDLYIPPEALEVFLEAFEGPLDLLLYLIKRQNLDILEINVSQITEQYMQYVNMMNAMQFELASEYLLMAAMLAEIKSRMLLPRSTRRQIEPSSGPVALYSFCPQRITPATRNTTTTRNVRKFDAMFRHISAAPP